MNLAKAEAAVLRFSYTVILMLVVPIAIVMTLDLIFYVKELLLQANYPSFTNIFSWNIVTSGSSVKLSNLLQKYTVITSDKFVFADSETFYRIKTLVEVATFLLIVSSRLSPKSSFSPVRKTSRAEIKRGRIKNAANARNLTKNNPQKHDIDHLQSKSTLEKQNLEVAVPLAHPNVCSLCGMSKSSSVLKKPSASLKKIVLVSKHKSLLPPTFWDSFQFLWSSLLRRSMRMIERSPLVQMLKYHELVPMWLSQLGLGKSSLFTSKAASIIRSSSRLPNKRRWVKMMGHSQ